MDDVWPYEACQELETMACHVYDSSYCRVMTIAVCDMQSKDVAVQSIL
jgi:hypothetical protein